MKKLAAVALALVMLMAVPFGYAEEAEMPYEGEWVEFEDTLTVYLPSELADVEISEEDLPGIITIGDLMNVIIRNGGKA